MRNQPRTKRLINTAVNVFKDFSEIIYYKEPFEVTYGKQPETDKIKIDTDTGEILNKRQRRFVKVENEELPDPIGDATYNELFENLERSIRRSKDNFYGYGLCNDWQYFCTFTVSIADYDSTDKATKYYWQLFRQKLQYTFADIKMLAVPEYHKKGNLHFHALLGNVNLDSVLVIAVNPHTQQPILKNGKQVYNLPLWDKGFSTVVKIDNHTDLETQMKAVAYFCKYLTKNNREHINYNQKRYYRTNNLDFKTKELSLGSLGSLEKSFSKSDILFHKETDNIVVYRVKNKPKLPPDMELITDPDILADMPW